MTLQLREALSDMRVGWSRTQSHWGKVNRFYSAIEEFSFVPMLNLWLSIEVSYFSKAIYCHFRFSDTKIYL